MDPELRKVLSQEEILQTLARNPHASNPAFQSFMQSKLSELTAKKQALSNAGSSPDSTASTRTAVGNMRYQEKWDVSKETSTRTSGHFTFTSASDSFTDLQAFPAASIRSSPITPLSVPASAAFPPSQTSQEFKYRALYEAERKKSEEERLKTKDTIIAMQTQLLQEKDRRLEDMRNMMQAYIAMSPGNRGFDAFFTQEIGTLTEKKKTKEENSEENILELLEKDVETTAEQAGNTEEEAWDGVYHRMISNDSEALRDEYEQNFECVLYSPGADSVQSQPK